MPGGADFVDSVKELMNTDGAGGAASISTDYS